MPILETLTLAEATSKHIVSRENGFRTKMLDAIDLQIAAASAEIAGKPYKRVVQRRTTNGQTGGREETDVEVRFRPWWWKDAKGTVFLELRYANKAAELKPGRSAFSIGTMDKLIPTLEQIKAAVSAGELDKPISAILATRKRELKKSASTPAIPATLPLPASPPATPAKSAK